MATADWNGLQKLRSYVCSKWPSGEAAGGKRPEAYPLGYVEDRFEPRTKPEAIFNRQVGFYRRTCGQASALAPREPLEADRYDR